MTASPAILRAVTIALAPARVSRWQHACIACASSPAWRSRYSRGYSRKSAAIHQEVPDISGLEQLLLARSLEEAGEPLGLGRAGAPAEPRQTVKPGTPAAGFRARRRIDLDHQVRVRESREVAIEHARPELHPAVRAVEHVGHDAETVAILVREREQDLEPVRGQVRRPSGRFGPCATTFNHKYISTCLYS